MQIGVSESLALIGRVCKEEHCQIFLRLQSLLIPDGFLHIRTKPVIYFILHSLSLETHLCDSRTCIVPERDSGSYSWSPAEHSLLKPVCRWLE